MDESLLDRAAQTLAGASALVITAGAGMGVDSGLPDFRGDEGVEGLSAAAWTGAELHADRHPCVGIFSTGAFTVDVDVETCRAREPLPRCPRCGALARPNVLMFNDGAWDGSRTQPQEDRLMDWLTRLEENLVECGAGRAIATVRLFGERLVSRLGATLIRINPVDPQVPNGGVGLRMGARHALEALHQRWQTLPVLR